jgi:hypothetical protein
MRAGPLTTMNRERCPYCVEGNGFKLMTYRDDHYICLRCGHIIHRDNPRYVCHCLKCEQLNRRVAS